MLGAEWPLSATKGYPNSIITGLSESPLGKAKWSILPLFSLTQIWICKKNTISSAFVKKKNTGPEEIF
jgi:hypothetical protein